jgi:mono/diheme cytochrome c family protein
MMRTAVHCRVKTLVARISHLSTPFGSQLKLLLCIVLALIVLAACATGSAPAQPVTDGGIDGEALYIQYCAACHGPEGEGQPNWRTPNEQGVYPAPPHDNSGHTWHHSDEVLLRITAEGGSLPNSGMPAFGETLSEAEMKAILAHIKTFWGAQEREFQQEITR